MRYEFKQILNKNWQDILTDIMTRMKPFMISGRLVTFKTLLENESEIFKLLLISISVPDGVLALYMPPSVRHQMMYANHGADAQIAIDHDSGTPQMPGWYWPPPKMTFQ
jgi:hypothetical protein